MLRSASIEPVLPCKHARGTTCGWKEVYLEHQALLAPVGQGELNLAVQAARPQEGRIQRVRPVGRHDDLDAPTHSLSGMARHPGNSQREHSHQ